jgi:hypothetical protein
MRLALRFVMLTTASAGYVGTGKPTQLKYVTGVQRVGAEPVDWKPMTNISRLMAQ